MTVDLAGMHQSAFTLLLELLEIPDPVLAGSVLADHYPDSGAALLAAGLLQSDGYQAVAADPMNDEDSPISLTWNAELSSYGYVGGPAGWVSVPGESLRQYRVSIVDTLSVLVAGLKRPFFRAPDPLVGDLLWDVGDVRLSGRSANVSIWFGRRLFDPFVWRVVREKVQARATSRDRVLLTSTVMADLADQALPSTTIVSLTDVVAVGQLFGIQASSLVRHLDRCSTTPTNGLPQIIGDGREVRFRGEVYKFPRGEQQRRIIRLLHDRAREGHRKVSTAEIAATLDLGDRTRVRDIFKGHPAWRRLLDERGGVCGFCWEDDYVTI